MDTLNSGSELVQILTPEILSKRGVQVNDSLGHDSGIDLVENIENDKVYFGLYWVNQNDLVASQLPFGRIGWQVTGIVHYTDPEREKQRFERIEAARKEVEDVFKGGLKKEDKVYVEFDPSDRFGGEKYLTVVRANAQDIVLEDRYGREYIVDLPQMETVRVRIVTQWNSQVVWRFREGVNILDFAPIKSLPGA